jgi:cyclase
MLMKRIVVCLDVDRGQVKKGVRFEQLRGVGDPVSMAERYEKEGADEIVYLDISASSEGRATMLDVVRRTADRVFIPLTVGGGIRSLDDVRSALRAGADKVAINSAAVATPAIIDESARRFGAQCVVVSVDARRVGDSWRVYTHGARTATELDAAAWARECESRGAGEILLTSIDRDGSRAGYDLELTSVIAAAVSIPVIASGGAGSPEDVAEVLAVAGADAALVAGMLHDGLTSVAQIKAAVAMRGLAVRSAA